MKGLYHDILLDHYKYPRNSDMLPSVHFSSCQYNPACGDSAQVSGILSDEQTVQVVAFKTIGCVICVATASLLSEKIKGMTIAGILSLNSQDIFELIGMSLGPTRLKCALLPLMALQDGLQSWQQTK